MTVDNEDPVAEPMFERNKGDNVHAGIPKLEGDHSQIRLHFVENYTHASTQVLLTTHINFSLIFWYVFLHDTSQVLGGGSACNAMEWGWNAEKWGTAFYTHKSAQSIKEWGNLHYFEYNTLYGALTFLFSFKIPLSITRKTNPIVQATTTLWSFFLLFGKKRESKP